MESSLLTGTLLPPEDLALWRAQLDCLCLPPPHFSIAAFAAPEHVSIHVQAVGSAMGRRPGLLPGFLIPVSLASEGRPVHLPGLPALSEPQGSEPLQRGSSECSEHPPHCHVASYLHKTKEG